MMKQAIHIAAFALAFAVTALAQWDGTLFDGESKKWGYGYDRAEMVVSGIAERARITWGDDWTNSIDITPRRWGSSWTLEEAKDAVAYMLANEDWVDMAQLTNGTFDVYFEGVTHDEDFMNDPHFPFLNTSNICVNVGASTNYFDEHPHWGAVAHSNGWQYIDDMLNEMVAVQRMDAVETNQVRQGSGDFVTVSGTGTSWADAKSDAESNYSSGSWVFDDYYENESYQMGRADSASDYHAWIHHYREGYIVTNVFPFAADWTGYQFADSPDGIIYDDQVELDYYGSGLTNTYTEMWSEIMPTNTQTFTDWIDPTMPGTWPIEPDPADADKDQSIRGYSAWSMIELWRFDVTNGFDYVE